MFLFQALLKYIKSQGLPGAVLIFLPGWNLIFAIMRYLQTHPVFGKILNGTKTFRVFYVLRIQDDSAFQVVLGTLSFLCIPNFLVKIKDGCLILFRIMSLKSSYRPTLRKHPSLLMTLCSSLTVARQR